MSDGWRTGRSVPRLPDLVDFSEVRGLERDSLDRHDLGAFRCHAIVDLGDAHFDFWHRKIVRERNRRAEALLVVRDAEGRLLLHTKAHYPTGGWRLLTGGIRPGEAAAEAARREVFEETGIEASIGAYLGLITYRLYHRDIALPFASYVFEVSIADTTPTIPDDDEAISGFRWIAPARLPRIAERLRRVEPRWRDWGRFRAVGHDELWARRFARTDAARIAPR